MTEARFVVFEGGEASGKSTQAARLAERIGAVLTREPGGTPTGLAIRSVVLEPGAGAVSPRTEALLMAADRAQHVEEVIAPALLSGRHVVSDRHVGSSLAYQGHGRGLPIEEIDELSRWATGGVVPDLVVLLDMSVAVARARLADTAPDRMESEDEAFHLRVRDGFIALAAERPETWVVVDGEQPVDEVTAAVDAAVAEHLGL